jgi:acyl carrier protein
VEQNDSHDPASVDALVSWLHDWMASEMGIDRERINPCETFLGYGMDSVQAMTMVGDLEAKLGRRLPPTLAWDYPTISALAAHLAACSSETPSAPERRGGAAVQVESLLAEFDAVRDRDAEGPLARYVESTQER